MRSSFLLGFLLLQCINVSAQHIVAGDFAGNPGYHDYNPDTTLAVDNNITATKTIAIDMNNDNTDDYLISVSHTNNYQWRQYGFVSVQPLNGN